MHTYAQFNSTIFNPFLPESSQVNDGVYGAELAWWLCKKLAEKKIFTSYPEFEDHTWVLSYIAENQEFEVHCHNQFQMKNQWQIQLKAFRPGLFKNKSFDPAKPLLNALGEVLKSTSEITALTIYPTC